MFNFFKKDPLKDLQKQYAEMLEKSFKLSHSDRAASDKLRAEAEKIADEIEKLKSK